MKNRPKTYLKTKLLFVLVSLLFATCQNEDLVSETEQSSNFGIPTMQGAKSNFSEANPNQTSFFNHDNGLSKRNGESPTFEIDWAESRTKLFKEGVDFLYTPIHKNLEARTKTILASVLNEGTVKSYAYTLAYDDNSNNEQFSGYIFKHDIEGNFVSAYRYNKGQKTDVYILDETGSSGESSKSSNCNCKLSVADIIFFANACGACVENMLDCVCITGGGSSGNGNGNNGWSDPNDDLTNDNTGGGGTGGGTGDTDNGGGTDNNEADELWWLEELNFSIDETGTSKVNPEEELKCYNLNAPAKLTVYVQQPRENSDDVVGPNQVGHAFVGIEQNGIVRQIGFYPESGANSVMVGVGKDYDSELRDNYDYLYHLSISKDITTNQLTSIIDYIEDYPKAYNVNDYACTDFAIHIGNLAQMNLPSTTVNHLIFSGRSPGKLGQEIRALQNNPNTSNDVTITTTNS
tara:strand:- start:571 stop:1956 length:1386 start_codon:yes stop_codon:yes gene_type:complete